MRVLMVGPLPTNKTWGVATVVSSLAEKLALLNGVDVCVYADNLCSNDRSELIKKYNHYYIHKNICPRIKNFPIYMNIFGLNTVIKSYIFTIYYDFRYQYWLRPMSSFRFSRHHLFLEKMVQDFRPDIIHVHHPLERLIISKLASKETCPIVTTLHSANFLLEANETRKSILKKVTLRNLGYSHGIICVSNFVRNRFIDLGVSRITMEYIPNGVDLSLYSQSHSNNNIETLQKLNSNRFVLFTGNLIHRKGIDHLIKAFAKIIIPIKDAILVIVGDGPAKKNLQQLASSMIGLENRVIFTGRKTPSELLGYYRHADVFVLPSSAEGLSISLLEAMASGLPVITTHPDGTPHDAIIHKENGLLTSYGDIDGLAKAIRRVLENRELAEKLAKNAVHTIENDYTWETIAASTHRYYKKVISRGRLSGMTGER